MTYGYCQAGMSVALRDDTVVLGKLYRSYVSIWGGGGGGFDGINGELLTVFPFSP